MYKKKNILLGLFFAALFLPVSAFAAEVAQGVCQKYDGQKHVVVIEEYDTNFDEQHKYGLPTGIVAEFDVSEAKIGILPENGDILRIAYILEGDTRVALKVMNVSKQDLRKK